MVTLLCLDTVPAVDSWNGQGAAAWTQHTGRPLCLHAVLDRQACLEWNQEEANSVRMLSILLGWVFCVPSSTQHEHMNSAADRRRTGSGWSGCA